MDLCLLVGFFSAVFSVYLIDDLLTVNIFMYASCIIALQFSASRLVSIAGFFAAAQAILLFELHPSFLGAVPSSQPSPLLEVSGMLPFFCTLTLLGASSFMLRLLFEKALANQKTISHLEMVGKQLVLFNHQLHETAKQLGDDAIKQDRLRFTRDLHDCCGYAFTNIIMISDAAVSQGQIDSDRSQEIFQRIRTLASNGLNDARGIIYLIRQIQETCDNSIDTILKLKKIFEGVTGIKVDVEWGNMRHDYGAAITKVISRILQEAFTNAIRHGKATQILIQFWELPEELTMTVTDNGIGSVDVVKGIGLAGMEERLETIAGKLEVSIPPEGGFCLRIAIPVTRENYDRK